MKRGGMRKRNRERRPFNISIELNSASSWLTACAVIIEAANFDSVKAPRITISDKQLRHTETDPFVE